MTTRGSGLIVPMETIRELVEPWLELLPATSRELPPHVTALWPFLPANALDAQVERQLEGLLAGAAPFDLTLSRVATFTDVTYLVPEPADPFIGLTQLLWREWPECPPYAGAYPDVVPHLTVALDPTAIQRRTIEAQLSERLPIAVRAEAVLLVEEGEEGVLRERRRFVLGGGSGPIDAG